MACLALPKVLARWLHSAHLERQFMAFSLLQSFNGLALLSQCPFTRIVQVAAGSPPTYERASKMLGVSVSHA